jgi:hypothetical protein
VNATVTRIRRHHPPVSALRRNFTLFALGHCQTCKTAHGTEYRNGEEYLDHVPTSNQGDAAQRQRSADELTGGLFSGDFEIVSAPGAVPWEITTHRAPGKGEHDKSRADNLSHGHKSP